MKDKQRRAGVKCNSSPSIILLWVQIGLISTHPKSWWSKPAGLRVGSSHYPLLARWGSAILRMHPYSRVQPHAACTGSRHSV